MTIHFNLTTAVALATGLVVVAIWYTAWRKHRVPAWLVPLLLFTAICAGLIVTLILLKWPLPLNLSSGLRRYINTCIALLAAALVVVLVFSLLCDRINASRLTADKRKSRLSWLGRHPRVLDCQYRRAWQRPLSPSDKAYLDACMRELDTMATFQRDSFQEVRQNVRIRKR